MKIRSGFVSNSSTTSFCVFGVGLESKEVKNLRTFFEETDKITAFDGMDICELYDVLDEKFKKIGLSLESHEDYYFWLGATPEQMGQDETRREFEKRITEKLSGILGKDLECDWITYGWYDG